MTLLEVVNQVLRRLREDEVTALSTSDYARLIGEFVVDVHQEVALAHDWGKGYKDILFDCVVNQVTYDLTATLANGGSVDNTNGVVTNENCEPQSLFSAWVYASDTSTEPKSELRLVEPSTWNSWYNQDTDYDNVPEYAKIYMKDDGTGYCIDLYPLPDDTYRVSVPFWIAETQLVTDGTDDDTSINIPTRPIILGAMFLALNERGEEIGEPGNIAERRYYDSLDKAIEADEKARILTNRYDWYRD